MLAICLYSVALGIWLYNLYFTLGARKLIKETVWASKHHQLSVWHEHALYSLKANTRWLVGTTVMAVATVIPLAYYIVKEVGAA